MIENQRRDAQKAEEKRQQKTEDGVTERRIEVFILRT